MDAIEIRERDRTVANLIESACPNGGDEEINHGLADDILCHLLEELGFIETVAAFKAVEKWYA